MTTDLHHFVAQLEADSSLFEPDQLRRRLEALDELDAYFGDTDLQTFTNECNHDQICERATAIRTRLEALNSAIYESIRNQIQQGAQPSRFHQWIQICRDTRGSPSPGLGYDHLDELMSGVLQLSEPKSSHIHLAPEMVFYQPTPMRHILHLIEVSELSETDLLVDLGSGLGHVPILASILTGTRSIGIESEAAYVASARDCIHNLGLSPVTFVQQNASDADLSSGTVFYMYTPFTGTLLEAVLRKLRTESTHRTITICTLGPCTSVVAKESWLKPTTTPDTDQITCFRSSA